jgi:NAD(P)-dependent dehydrogenase (short-subunit alcohol dehydrogenase family)
VNSVHPGVIMTDIQKVAERDNPGVGEKIQATIPMRRMGDPSDIAAAIAFLASSDARYVTGTEIVVDGGLTAQ